MKNDVVWSYDVRVSSTLDLDVVATYRDPSGPLRVDGRAKPYITADSLECDESCRVHYHVRLRDAATALADVDVALLAGGAIFAPPSTWLLRPTAVPASGRYRFRVTTPRGVRFATGVRPLAGRADTYEARTKDLEAASFAGFGALRLSALGGSVIAAAPDLTLSDRALSSWAEAAVAALSAYFGREPSDRCVIFVVPGTSEVTRGKTLDAGGPAVLVRIGTTVREDTLLEDWVLSHELVHVTMPSVGYEHAWFSEGLATYIEPVARAQAGQLEPAKVWGDLVDGLPQGRPGPGDTGLAGTEEWGRVYWGGALYFLLADLAIRADTASQHSLRDALRAIAASSGGVESYWSLESLLEVGDRATGTEVLHRLYDRLGRAPGWHDVDRLSARLGIRKEAEWISFDDSAPLASIRLQITRASK